MYIIFVRKKKLSFREQFSHVHFAFFLSQLQKGAVQCIQIAFSKRASRGIFFEPPDRFLGPETPFQPILQLSKRSCKLSFSLSFLSFFEFFFRVLSLKHPAY
jgi:hypothetical protein